MIVVGTTLVNGIPELLSAKDEDVGFRPAATMKADCTPTDDVGVSTVSITIASTLMADVRDINIRLAAVLMRRRRRRHQSPKRTIAEDLRLIASASP